MQELENNIRDFGRKSDWESLNEFINQEGIENVINLIKSKINNPDFESLWTYLLHSLREDLKSQSNRFKMVLCCLETLHSKEINTSNATAIVSRLCGELGTFKTAHLVDLCQKCLELIQKGNVNAACWSRLLPEILTVIVKKEVVENNGDEMSGIDYKTQVIKALTFMEWSANIVIPLTMMFIDIPLTKEEHLEVTHKLGKYMEKLTPQELPMFTYNFLKLCRHQNSKLVFFCLQHYFSTRIYHKDFIESESMDLISTAPDEEVFQAQSTVLYHIQECALLSHKSFKEYFNFLKKLTKAPEFILNPFQLTVLLSISTIAIHKDGVFAIIKQAVCKVLLEESKRTESNWLKSMINDSLNLKNIFRQVIERSAKDCELVLHGLMNLSFVLLDASALLGHDDPIVCKQWDLGKYILLKLTQQEVQVAPTVLKKLCEEIVANRFNTTQYSDCFYDFSKRFPVLILENKGCIFQALESLILIPGNASERVLDAVISLTKPSPTVRDHLILLLRKGLHSRVVSAQIVSVKGFLKLLTILKISNLASLSSQFNGSQSSSSGRSVLTQISINCTVHSSQTNAFSNEAICLEVLGILKRCFTQPVTIKYQLYEEISKVVSKNEEIGGAVLELLWNHFLKYYVSDEDVCPPINFKAIYKIKDIDVELEEPIGKLLFTISLITIKVLKIDSENLVAKKIITILDSILERMVRCELVHFELDDGSYLLDVLPESQAKVITLEQAMTVYEALIGYRIASWDETSNNYGQDVYNLFQGYFRLQRCALDAHRSKKVGRKKKDKAKTGNEENKDCSMSKTSSSTQNETVSTTKVKSAHIKIPDTILNFKVVTKLLKILHCNVDFTSTNQTNQLKSKSEIHRHAMQSTIYLFNGLLKSKKHTNNPYKDYDHCLNISKIIYKRCIERMDEFVDFDPITTVLAAECFGIILKLVSNRFNDKLSQFLCQVADIKETEFLSHINVFIEKYQELFEADFSEGTGESDGKKLLLIIISTLETLIRELPDESTLISNKFLDWIKTYSTQNTITSKPVISTFFNLWFTSYIKFKSGVGVFEEIVDNLINTFGSLTQEKEGVKTFEIINESTSRTCIEKISLVIKIMLDNIDLVINRLTSEYLVLMYPNVQSIERRKENLKNKERGISCQLCFLVTLLDSVCTVLMPIGNLSEAVLKNSISLYNCLNNCTKYFITKSTNINPTFQTARFDRVIKLAGRQLSPSINKFILNLEETQKENETQAKKKKSGGILKNKVLCETKSIPKVVYETEQFSRLVTELSKKTKIDVSKYIGVGTTRDFRIKDINNVLKKSSDHNSSLDKSITDESLQETINEEEQEGQAETQANISSVRDVSDEEEEESEAPPSKKLKC